METLIQFFYEEVDFVLNHEQDFRNWIHNAIEQESMLPGVINIIFCSDDYLLDLNQRFLDRNTLTDVIAFDYGEDHGVVSGDVFISLERTNDNARKFNISSQHELHRVIIHGILHLCGYSDKSETEKAEMTILEDKYLSLLPH